MNRIAFVIICLPLLFASCRHEVVSSAYQDLDEHGWAVTDTIRLALNVEDTTQAYDLAVNLRHTALYTYQNLWLFMQATDSISPQPVDTVLACLANDRGRWLGTRAGRYYTGYVIAEHGLIFPRTGIYNFTIVHGMRDSVIPGIADIGLELRINHGQE